MPLYEYQCRACGHRFERIQKFSDPLATDCPSCGGTVDKLVSSPAIQFKGSGFYITDYAKSGKAETDSKPDSKPAGSAESSSETKSEKGDSTKTTTESTSTPTAKPPSTSDPK